MSTIIEVTDKKFTFPKLPQIIQTDKGAEEFEFQITDDVDLSDATFLLKYKNSKNEIGSCALTKLGTTTAGAIRLQWKPDAEFTSVCGNTTIQIQAKISTTLVWNTVIASVPVYEGIEEAGE